MRRNRAGGEAGGLRPASAHGSPAARIVRIAGKNFALRLLFCWGVLLLIAACVPAYEQTMLRATLSSLGWIGAWVGRPGWLSSETLSIAGVSVRITTECTPMMPALVLAAAFAASGLSWRRKLVAWCGSLAILWVYNLGRILSTALVLAWRPALFDFVHVYLWQTATVLVCTGLFLFAHVDREGVRS